MAKRKTASTAETLVTFLLDRSGSMQSVRDDTIGAFNAYLDTLKASADPIRFSFLQFDSMSIDTLCKNVPIAEAASLSQATFEPRGSTPLIDAAFKTIKAVEDAVAKRDAEPKVVICIQTDGQENCSTAHTWADLNALIKDKAALGWQFNFMGAGIDAYAQGQRMGISAGSTLSYDHKDANATRAAFAATAMNTMSFAAGRSSDVAYSAKQKATAGDKYAVAGPHPTVAKSTAKPRSLVDDVTL